MALCYVLPGYAGTELFRSGQSIDLLWVNKALLALDYLFDLRLDDTGSGPDPARGVPCTPGNPMKEYYGDALDALKSQLEPEGFTITPWGYDWRKSVLTSGRKLSIDIIAKVKPDDPCSIVAHSLGGLVSRVAWYELRRKQKEGLVRRIVTLGTAHQGSYKPYEYLGLRGEVIEQLMYLYRTAPLLLPVIGHRSPERIVSMMCTWPSTYELMPQLNVPSTQGDVPLASLYNERVWPDGRGIRQFWLDHARKTMMPFWKDELSIPPLHVLTTIAGETRITPNGCGRFLDQFDGNYLTDTPDGDGTVTTVASLMPRSVQVVCNSLHWEMPRDLALSGEISKQVLDVRTPPNPPPGPPPPPVVEAAPVSSSFFLNDPPLAVRPQFVAGG